MDGTQGLTHAVLRALPLSYILPGNMHILLALSLSRSWLYFQGSGGLYVVLGD